MLEAVRLARRRNPTLGKDVFDFVRDTLLGREPPGGGSDDYRLAQRWFAGKFEQVTAPVTAKTIKRFMSGRSRFSATHAFGSTSHSPASMARR